MNIQQILTRSPLCLLGLLGLTLFFATALLGVDAACGQVNITSISVRGRAAVFDFNAGLASDGYSLNAFTNTVAAEVELLGSESNSSSEALFNNDMLQISVFTSNSIIGENQDASASATVEVLFQLGGTYDVVYLSEVEESSCCATNTFLNLDSDLAVATESFTGRLGPGNYSIRSFADSVGYNFYNTFSSSRATVGLTLTPATVIVGDCNLDGSVTFADIPSFIPILQAGTFLAEADCNEDGVVTFADIASFIAILQAG